MEFNEAIMNKFMSGFSSGMVIVFVTLIGIVISRKYFDSKGKKLIENRKKVNISSSLL